MNSKSGFAVPGFRVLPGLCQAMLDLGAEYPSVTFQQW